MFKRILEKLIAGRQRTADFYILHNLTDKELRDIGVTRGEIHDRVYNRK